MATYRIRPCARLSGEITVHSAKNAVLPLMCGALLTRETVTIEQIPALTDVKTLTDILRDCGVLMRANQTEKLLTLTADSPRSPRREDLLSRMRASVLVMGPLLARTGYARVALPGGCAIGQRPIDLHLKGMEALGAHVEQTPGFVTLRGKLRGGNVYLDFPSVGATENAMLAACAAAGETVICNAAREPEILDLQCYLRKLGARISGAGTSTVTVSGFRPQPFVEHTIMPDRIVAATILCAGAACGGDVELQGVDPDHFLTVLDSLSEAGCAIIKTASTVRLTSTGRLTAPRPVVTQPYPGFPTDAQPPLMAACLKAKGTTVFTENIFTNRYRHAEEFRRLGAAVSIEGRVAYVTGVDRLTGAPLTSSDLRGGAAMIVAGLSAEGETEILDNGYINRGYDRFDACLSALGADVRCVAPR